MIFIYLFYIFLSHLLLQFHSFIHSFIHTLDSLNTSNSYLSIVFLLTINKRYAENSYVNFHFSFKIRVCCCGFDERSLYGIFTRECENHMVIRVLYPPTKHKKKLFLRIFYLHLAPMFILRYACSHIRLFQFQLESRFISKCAVNHDQWL